MGAVERYYQLAVLGLVASGYAGVALTGYLDRPTLIFAGLALIVRALQIFGVIRVTLPSRFVEVCALFCIFFYPVDYFYLSHDFLIATVHMIIILAVLKILSTRTRRDHFYSIAISFLELLAAAILSSSISFFLVLTVFLCCLIAALTSGEIRRAAARPSQQIAQLGRIRVAPRLGTLAVTVTSGILLITAGLFFVLPRTAGAALRGLARHNYHLSGFSSTVRLGEVGELQLDSRTIMRVKPYHQFRLPVGLKWRGLIFSQFDGRAWSVSPHREPLDTRQGVVQVATDSERLRNGPAVTYRVDLSPLDSDALFIAGLPDFLNVGVPRIFRMEGSAYRLGYIPSEAIRYEVSSAINSAFAPGSIDLTLRERGQYLQLPHRLDPRIPELAREFAGHAADDLQRARNIEASLHRRYAYTLQLPAKLPKDPLADFLFERKQGHCEYFSSAMAVMLRTQGIPSRVVNGFAGGTYNPVSDLYMIQASDAHSWVEAFIDGPGWMTFDPTPPAVRVDAPSLMTTIGYYLDAADAFWQEWVLNYDLARQFILGASIELGIHDWAPFAYHRAAPRMDQAVLTRSVIPLVFLIFAAVMILVFWRSWFGALRLAWQYRRIRPTRAKPTDAAILYARMLALMKKKGYQKPAWFTPREFAATVRMPAVDEFTSAYHSLRYGGDLSAIDRMKEILSELSR
jgi:transglutaminase-like putative cysteine protease